MRFLFASHGERFVPVRIIKPGFLFYGVTLIQKFGLSVHLVLNGFLDEFERIKIFQFCSGAKLFLSNGTNGNVSVTTQAPFFHVAIADSGIF